jgi:hypothetical protein
MKMSLMPQSTMQIESKQLFENGYGVSVIPEADGETYEIAVLLHTNGKYVRLTYDTPVTNDVIRYASKSQTEEVIERIRNLPTAT